MTELDLLKKPEYIHVVLNHLPIYGTLGPGHLINPPEPSCTDYGPYPHARCGGFSIPGLRDRTEGLQDNPRHGRRRRR